MTVGGFARVCETISIYRIPRSGLPASFWFGSGALHTPLGTALLLQDPVIGIILFASIRSGRSTRPSMEEKNAT